VKSNTLKFEHSTAVHNWNSSTTKRRNIGLGPRHQLVKSPATYCWGRQQTIVIPLHAISSPRSPNLQIRDIVCARRESTRREILDHLPVPATSIVRDFTLETRFLERLNLPTTRYREGVTPQSWAAAHPPPTSPMPPSLDCLPL
jgi:hypothetical protein